ncbi:chlorophyll synthesis pathway protein BchC [Prosthecomicrobium sp. N25]|uniref:chlorophyll synthesis pathway protein BchC n=1 Tax=Prosthecomicrobium sp. N25 TaxID=3129254 RepID=UPI0030778C30
MQALAVVLEAPERLAVEPVELQEPSASDVVVDVAYSGISTGTERLLYSGRMPPFPGLGYPLVPGYETVGRVVEAGPDSGRTVGETVFVPGSRCFTSVRGLFGGAASRLVVPGSRAAPIRPDLAEKGVLLALAATAHHAVAGGPPPKLVVGHGVLGRLIVRVAMALGAAPPVVWETNPTRARPDGRYTVLQPDEDTRRDYSVALDASGAPDAIDRMIARLAPGGEVVLAGFYEGRVGFAFPPAFMREARIRIAAEWKPEDLTAAKALVDSGRLSLDGLVTHVRAVDGAADAYRTAFDDPGCLKMILDWRGCA